MLKKFIQTALLLVVLCTTATTYAQIGQSPEGIQFQALATDANGHPAAGRVIYVKDAIVAKTATGTIVYSETFKVTASSAGIFTIVLGKGTYASGVSSIANIDWANGPFFLNLKIAVEPSVPNASWNVNNEYVDLGTSQFWSTPYALYAGNVKGMDTKLNIADTAAMLKPYFTSINLKANIESPTFTGTVSGITKAMVGLGNVDNTADIDKPVSSATQAALDLKVDKVTGKALSTNDYTTTEKTKLAAITGTNTGDQDLSALAIAADVNAALALKANTVDVNAALALKANGANVASSLALKANTTDVNNALIAKADIVAVNNSIAALNASLVNKADNIAVANQLGIKEDKLNKSVNVTLDAASDAKYPSVKAVKTYVDAQVAGATIADASATEKGKIQLAGDLAGTAAAPTVPGLALKENLTNKSTDVTTDAASDTKYPSVKAVKKYVDAQVAGATIADASATEKGKIQLAGDLAGTAVAPTVPGLALKAPIASPTFTGTVTTGAINTGTLSSTSITAPTYASTPIALTYSGSNINWNPAQGLNAAITLTQNSGLNFTAAPPVGSYGTVVLTQDATGSRTITLPTIAGATNKVLGSTSTSTVALSTVANSKDILNFYFDGTSCYWNIGQGYGAAATTGTTNLATSVNGTLAVANGGTGANSLTGLVKGNGSSALTAAVAGIDYQAPLTLTTSGTGAATLSGTTLNIPTVTAVTSTDASTLTGTVVIAKGGTGATTATAALTNLGAAPIASPTFTGSVTAPIYASTPQTLTFGSPISWNPANGLNAKVTLTGNGTLSFSAAPASGSYGTLVVTQGTGGNFTLTLPSTDNKVLGSTSGTTIALSTAAGSIDILNFYYDGSKCYWNVGQGYGSASSFTATNIAGGAAGSIPYQTAAGATSLLAKGTDGQILTLASGVPSWSAAPVTGVSTATSPLSISATTISLGTVPVANGGTGAATLTGLVKGNGTNAMTAAFAGTDYLEPNGSAASLTNFPTLNQNTTGNAANVTGIVAVVNGGTGTTTGSITGTTALSFAAGGSNQNVSILPSGTGSVGIGTNSPNSSAILDASSTTKGFLPPRMTYAQKMAIASPPQGLMIYCTNCGTNGEPEYYNGVAWVNMAGGTAASVPPPPLGSTYEGGKVFYIFQPGDPGYVAGETHGLIAAPSDIPSNTYRILVGCYGNYGTSTALGTGAANTTKLLACSDAVNAAKLVDALTVGGYSDWYLPSKDELNILYLNRNLVGNFIDWPGYSYWSSSEFYLAFASHAWFQRFSDGSQDGEGKNYQKEIRAIRSF